MKFFNDLVSVSMLAVIISSDAPKNNFPLLLIKNIKLRKENNFFIGLIIVIS